LATYGRVNKYGFIETPYRRVRNTIPGDSAELVNHDAFVNIVHPETGEIIVAIDETITEKHAKAIKEAGIAEVQVKPFITDDIIYMSADEEDHYSIAQANARIDERGQFADRRVSSRRNLQFRFTSVQRIDFIDVAPRQIVGIS